METRSLDPLVRFCTEQERRFDPDAWRRSESVDRDSLAVAAQYLSMTSWYGHELDLESLAEELHPGISSIREFELESAARGFDLSGFSIALRYRIVATRHRHE